MVHVNVIGSSVRNRKLFQLARRRPHVLAIRFYFRQQNSSIVFSMSKEEKKWRRRRRRQRLLLLFVLLVFDPFTRFGSLDTRFSDFTLFALQAVLNSKNIEWMKECARFHAPFIQCSTFSLSFDQRHLGVCFRIHDFFCVCAIVWI